MNSQILLSPAKVNLTLQVLKKREDSYHEIYTIYQKITLFDEMEIKVQPNFEMDFKLEFVAEENILLERNLVFRAYKLFVDAYGVKERFKVKVVKRIPMGSGLGGGSSNAGTLLRFLGQRYGIPKEELLALGKKLGADVPFFIEEYSSAIGFGIGDILKPFPNYQAFYLLYYPGFKVETAWAYRGLNLKDEKKPYLYREDCPPWHDPKGLINHFKDLIYSTYPQYQDFERCFRMAGAKVIALSGTGSTMFAVFEDEESASRAYTLLKNFLKGGKIYLARNLS